MLNIHSGFAEETQAGRYFSSLQLTEVYQPQLQVCDAAVLNAKALSLLWS